MAARELLVARVLEMADVPAIRPADDGRGPLEGDDYVITLWHWIDGVDRAAQPAETGRLAARLHNSTATAVRWRA